jgi:hypothetical protein
MISTWGFEYKGLRDVICCWTFCLMGSNHCKGKSASWCEQIVGYYS